MRIHLAVSNVGELMPDEITLDTDLMRVDTELGMLFTSCQIGNHIIFIQIDDSERPEERHDAVGQVAG